MKVIIIGVLALCSSISLVAQNNINTILGSIEENNITLKARRETSEAQKLENKTGIYLQDPEVNFGYLWGKPTSLGNQKDFSVSQTFDIPTLTGMKGKVAKEQNQMVEQQYKTDRMAILLEAKQYCIDVIYYNALKDELNIRLQHAQTIAAGYKERLEKGDANMLEYNKVQLNLATVKGEISRIEVERDALLSQLKRLNGGIEIVLNMPQYNQEELPLNFDNWYITAEEKNPALAYVKQEIEVSKKQLSLNKAMRLPKFSAGYASEITAGDKFRGVSFGISIPLWENKNRVKQAKAAVRAAETRETDSKQQFYNQLQILYKRALGLKMTANDYRKTLGSVNNSELLKKALDAGEVSLLDYIVEMGLYYDMVNQTLEAERDYRKAFADLSAVEL